ncbi:MAG: ATP-grasp domain-containing protein [Patescibacteria group bacterium]|nr:ATP-grasp domain-containing protein [Patescibacteria group bacterium]
MTKIVLILFSKQYIDKNKKSQKLKKGFESLYIFAKKRGICFCKAPISCFNKKEESFDKAEFFESGHWIQKPDIVPNVIYDKTPFHICEKLKEDRRKISRIFTFINDLALSELMSDKWLTYQKFKIYSPKTVLIEKGDDLGKIKSLDCEKIILKPLSGSGGSGIEIVDHEKISNKQFPYIAQELITTNTGIKGIVDGPHDLRVIIKDDKLIYSYVRIPSRGRLLANLSQGAKIKVIDIENLPTQIPEIASHISKKLENFHHKLYSIDFAFDKKNKPWIIEMNSRPGITLEKDEGEKGRILWDNLIEMFKSC